MKKYKVSITPLTGIHIGKGEELDLFNYLLFRNKSRIKFGVFSLENVISELDTEKRKHMYELIDKNDIIELRKFFTQNIRPKHILYNSDVSDDFVKEYENNIDNLNNQLLVNSIQRNSANYLPIIPGSSIKGAIRTALLNKIINYKRLRINKKDLNKIEKIVLGYQDAKNDPLRALIVRDGYVTGSKVDFVTRVNVINMKNTFNKTGQKIFIEVIRGKLLEGDAKCDIELELFNNPFNINKKIYRWNPPKEKLNINMIINSCNEFYKNVFSAEKSNFYSGLDNNRDLQRVILELEREVGEIQESNECLIRLGRYSQIESITIEEYLNPKLPKGWGKSRTLALYGNEYYPLGWAKMKFKLIT